ncbi:MAG: glycine cleavage system aminomethyltransferase GcvT [Candidatus Omnitrophica bacterium]|nr:glycine cleavage system aminomethyltransferase GcvT [Candidatus Omnitrophota bacterium]
MIALKTTPLNLRHTQAGARLVDFFGWRLPLEYESGLKEAKELRCSCGLSDVSHMGEIKIKGKGTFEFLQKLVSNDLRLIRKGQLQYNLFLNQDGGIKDDLMVYNLGEEYLCVVNASNIDNVYAWLKEFKNDEIEIINESQSTSLLALQGPKSYLVMESILGKKLDDFKYMHFIQENVELKPALISRSGYTGEDGFEIYIESKDACFFWDLIMNKGADYGLKLCGLAARDILRIEAGYPLYGHEIDETTNPIEASLGWAVKLNKDFIGKEEIVKAKKNGVEKKRIGFLMQEKGLPRKDYDIYAEVGKTPPSKVSGGSLRPVDKTPPSKVSGGSILVDKTPPSKVSGGSIPVDKKIGRVTSGTYSPNLNEFIGMGYVSIDFSKPDTSIKIKIRDKFYQAKVVNFPFVEAKK